MIGKKISSERKVRQQACSTSDSADLFTNSLVHKMSSMFSQALNLKGSSNQAVVASEVGASSIKEGLVMDVDDKQVVATDSGGKLHDEAMVKFSFKFCLNILHMISSGFLLYFFSRILHLLMSLRWYFGHLRSGTMQSEFFFIC